MIFYKTIRQNIFETIVNFCDFYTFERWTKSANRVDLNKCCNVFMRYPYLFVRQNEKVSLFSAWMLQSGCLLAKQIGFVTAKIESSKIQNIIIFSHVQNFEAGIFQVHYSQACLRRQKGLEQYSDSTSIGKMG